MSPSTAAIPRRCAAGRSPSATDIAFAFAVISLLGKRVPASLRLFLLALAIIDDLGAIVIIAIFYTSDLSLLALSAGRLALAAMAVLNRLKVTRIAPYALLGLICWAFVLKSGCHATLAGVATSLLIPIRPARWRARPCAMSSAACIPGPRSWSCRCSASPMPDWSLPMSALAICSAGLRAVRPSVFFSASRSVFSAPARYRSNCAFASRPAGASWLSIYGVSILAGIGFTMSLFIGSLAWEDGSHAAALRLGVLGGSIVSAICGLVVLSMATKRRI